jgi:hypothetical protein
VPYNDARGARRRERTTTLRPNSTTDDETGSGPGGRTDRDLAAEARFRPTTVAAALFAVAIIVAACSSTPGPPGVAGGGPPTTTQATSPGKQPSALADMSAYAKCMRSHGIADFPDPAPDPGGLGGSFDFDATGDLNPANPSYQSANKACQLLLPEGGNVPTPSAKELAEEVNLAACMRAHGISDMCFAGRAGKARCRSTGELRRRPWRRCLV